MGESLARLVGSPPRAAIIVAVGGLPAVVRRRRAVVPRRRRGDGRGARRRPLRCHAGRRGTGPDARAPGWRVLRGCAGPGAVRDDDGRARSRRACSSCCSSPSSCSAWTVTARRSGSSAACRRSAAILGGLLLARAADRPAPATLIGLGFGGMAAWGFLTWNLPTLRPRSRCTLGVDGLARSGGDRVHGRAHDGGAAGEPGRLPRALRGTLETGGAVGQGAGAVLAGVLLDRVPLAALLNGQATIYAVVAVFGWATTRRPSPATGSGVSHPLARYRGRRGAPAGWWPTRPRRGRGGRSRRCPTGRGPRPPRPDRVPVTVNVMRVPWPVPSASSTRTWSPGPPSGDTSKAMRCGGSTSVITPITRSGAMYGVSGSPTAGARRCSPVSWSRPNQRSHATRRRARQLALVAHRPAVVGGADLRAVETELVDQLLVAGDAAVRRRRRSLRQHAAQAGEAQLPPGGEARRACRVVERVGERERRAVAIGCELERQSGRRPT